MGFGTKGCLYNCGNECTKECIPKIKEMKRESDKIYYYKPQRTANCRCCYTNISSQEKAVIFRTYVGRTPNVFLCVDCVYLMKDLIVSQNESVSKNYRDS